MSFDPISFLCLSVTYQVQINQGYRNNDEPNFERFSLQFLSMGIFLVSLLGSSLSFVFQSVKLFLFLGYFLKQFSQFSHFGRFLPSLFRRKIRVVIDFRSWCYIPLCVSRFPRFSFTHYTRMTIMNPKGKKQQQNQRSKLTREHSPSPGLILLLRMDLTSSSFSLPEL